MKNFRRFGAGMFAIAALTANADSTGPAATLEVNEVVAAFPASAGALTAPFVLKDGLVFQPMRTGAKEGGRLAFKFRVDAAGEYIVKAVVHATSDESNSFFVAIDGEAEDPATIWDIKKGPGLVERAVSWRGKGDKDRSEFVPKIFSLAAGEHTLLFVGREAAQLKSVSIVRHVRSVPPTRSEEARQN